MRSHHQEVRAVCVQLADKHAQAFDPFAAVLGSRRGLGHSRPRVVVAASAVLTVPESFEVYLDGGGLWRWRALDKSGRAIRVSIGGFMTRPGVIRSVAAAQEARAPGIQARIILTV